MIKRISWRASGVSGVKEAPTHPYLSSRYERITSDSKTASPSPRTSAGTLRSGLRDWKSGEVRSA